MTFVPGGRHSGVSHPLEKPVCTQAEVFPAGKSVLRHLLLAAGAPPGSSKGLQPHANVTAAKTAASQPLERSLPQAEGILQKKSLSSDHLSEI